jgi:ABC-type phosphate transport system permease subunit
MKSLKYIEKHIYWCVYYTTEVKMIRKNGILGVFMLAIMALPLIASAANDSFVPSFKDGMSDLPDDVKSTMSRVINWGQVALVAVAIIYTAYHGISAIIDGKRGNASGRSSHITNVFTGIGMLLVVGVVIALINYVVK